MQTFQFSNGGYVAHKVRINSDVSTMHFSVWFSAQGELLDAEGFDKAGRSRPVSQKARRILSTMYGTVATLGQ